MSSPFVRHLWQSKSQLEFRNGILYYFWDDAVAPRLLFITPRKLRQEMLHLCHDLRSAGHLGQDKTLAKLRHTVYWYGMTMDCKLYVSTCQICNRYKKPLKRAKAELDQFTKWLECCPLPNQNAEVVAKALMDSTISRFGCPMELHTDQGKNVDGRVIRQLCDLLEVSKTRTSAYHPASNGQVERYNRIITQLIRCFLKKTQNRWDIHLQQLAGAIRATENRQTGFTPNFMVFGREVNQPIDLVLGQIKERFPDQDICKYVQSLRNSLEDAHDIARDNLKSAQKRQKQDYDLNLNFRKYCVGDIVLKLDTARKVGISPKLKAPWKGPYVVIEVKSPALLKIKDRKREEVVHHDRLKLCIDREIPLWLQRYRYSI
ncbi:unnamed protein product [Mytilus edulis]|uniref:Integrase catalytic domain-containing protein n=1 Tax=Mytilus edulis TaxID=6550 RepID=A0A8S3V7T2_MYTED|nr:unnamed protein product [Mytilus edulis]